MAVALLGVLVVAALVAMARGGVDDGDGDGDALIAGTTTTVAPTGTGATVPSDEGIGPEGDPLVLDLPTDQLATIDGEAMAVAHVCRSGDGALVYVGSGGRRVELGGDEDSSVRLARDDDVGSVADATVSDHGGATLYEAEVIVDGKSYDVVAVDTGHSDDAERCG